ncbi:MAG: ribosome silencing factor [Maricaulaceae bacterium]
MESILSTIRNANTAAAVTTKPADVLQAKDLSDFILAILEENSAQDVIEIDVAGKSSIADYMIVASGRSNRHVNALADYVQRGLKERGMKDLGIEGLEASDWVLVDAGDVILHVFRPEVRAFYNIEKIWSVPLPDSIKDVSAADMSE